jgi:hypothetical protein
LNEQILISWKNNPPKKTFFFAITVHEKVKERESRQTDRRCVCVFLYLTSTKLLGKLCNFKKMCLTSSIWLVKIQLFFTLSIFGFIFEGDYFSSNRLLWQSWLLLLCKRLLLLDVFIRGRIS